MKKFGREEAIRRLEKDPMAKIRNSNKFFGNKHVILDYIPVLKYRDGIVANDVTTYGNEAFYEED